MFLLLTVGACLHARSHTEDGEGNSAMRKVKATPATTELVKPYEPTAEERRAVEVHRDRRRRQRLQIRAKASMKGEVVSLEPDHVDAAFGELLLMDALGTTQLDFSHGLFAQFANAATKGRVIDEQQLNFMLSMVTGIEPRDQLEAMLAAQMAAVHNATMTFARRLNHVDNIQQQDSAERAFNKLARTFACQLQALKVYRSSGQQHVTVTHLNVAAHQAQVNVGGSPGGGGMKNRRINLMESLPMHQAPRCRAMSKRSGKQCRAPAVAGKRVCWIHGGAIGSGAPIGNKNALRHGRYTAEAVASRRHLSDLIRRSRAVIAQIEEG